jgi:protein farnesyltransferase/geranylgeranyltransferase type-1 subunit alpha
VERLGTARDEKRFTRQVLEEDAKNYHAWAHRQWFVRRFGEFEDELEFCGELLAKDVRNNSAWNHRWFVVTSRSGAAAAVTRDEWEAEARFAMELAELALHNECPYNYLRGIARSAGGGKASPSSLADFPFVGSWAFKLAARAPASCAALTAFLVDALEAARRLEDARALCVQLAEHKDVVRSSYWLRRASRLR